MVLCRGRTYISEASRYFHAEQCRWRRGSALCNKACSPDRIARGAGHHYPVSTNARRKGAAASRTTHVIVAEVFVKATSSTTGGHRGTTMP